MFSAGGDVSFADRGGFFAAKSKELWRLKSSLKKPLPALPKINFGVGKKNKKKAKIVKNREVF